MSDRVTRAEAEAVLKEVRRVFRSHILPGDKGGPALLRNWEWISGYVAPYAVIWLEGPYEWAIQATAGGIDDELTELSATLPEYLSGHMKPIRIEAIKQPDGVFCEPYTSWALAVYRR
jgi:hypothetical protein